MNISDIVSEVERRIGDGVSVSRLKNQLIGTGYVTGLRAILPFINIPKPTVLVGKDSALKLCDSIAQSGTKRVLIVTDEMLAKIGLLDPLLERLDATGTAYKLFSEVQPDPSFDACENGLKVYRRSNCDSVLAFGGGSSIDVAKVIALAATNNAEPTDLVGFFKGKQAYAPFFCIPTTAGTGSEVTIGAVISDTETHQKAIVIDHKIVPLMAALDPVLMKGLPTPVTAATGVDALTHCIEAFLSDLGNEESAYYARAGIKTVFESLQTACKKGTQLKSRENMALASHYGGLALNISGLGYCHAFAHQLGARYGIPHGASNAKVLPHVMMFNKDACFDKFAELGELIGIEGSAAKRSSGFIRATKQLIADVGITPKAEGLKPEHYDDIIQAAFKEANSTYAVPHYMAYDEAVSLLQALTP